jgi:predicted RNase H-like nuclease (RuvC/YqgF family)
MVRRQGWQCDESQSADLLLYPYPCDDESRNYQREIEALKLKLEKEKVTSTQLRAELKELKPALEKETVTNTQLRAEIEVLKSEEAEIEWLRSELKRERSVSNALTVMITTVHKP